MDDALRGLADLVRSHRPPGAKAYYLHNGNGRFPASGGYSLEPFKPPNCPGGSYTLGFLENPSSNVTLSPAVAGFGAPIIPVPTCDGSVESVALAKQQAAGQSPTKQPDPLVTHPDHIKNRVEYEQVRMADDLVRSKLLMTDLGQSLLYAQAWRKEAQAAMSSQQEIAARERERAERDRQAADAEALRLSKLVQEERARLPSPPPDHFATSLAFLGQLAGLAGTALSPAIAKQQAGKTDPVVDALIGSGTEAERTPPDSAALLATKKELETARAELANKKAVVAATGAEVSKREATEKQPTEIVERALHLLEKMEQRVATLESATTREKQKNSKKKSTANASKPKTRNTQEVKKKTAKRAKR